MDLRLVIYTAGVCVCVSGEKKTGFKTVCGGDFKTPLSPKDRTSKLKKNKEPQALNDTLEKMDLIDICQTFHPKTTEYMEPKQYTTK